MRARGMLGIALGAVAVMAGSSPAMAVTHSPVDPSAGLGDFFVRRAKADRRKGGQRGKRHADKPRKRPNRLHVSRRVKHAHRKARRA